MECVFMNPSFAMESMIAMMPLMNSFVILFVMLNMNFNVKVHPFVLIQDGNVMEIETALMAVMKKIVQDHHAKLVSSNVQVDIASIPNGYVMVKMTVVMGLMKIFVQVMLVILDGTGVTMLNVSYGVLFVMLSKTVLMGLMKVPKLVKVSECATQPIHSDVPMVIVSVKTLFVTTLTNVVMIQMKPIAKHHPVLLEPAPKAAMPRCMLVVTKLLPL